MNNSAAITLGFRTTAGPPTAATAFSTVHTVQTSRAAGDLAAAISASAAASATSRSATAACAGRGVSFEWASDETPEVMPGSEWVAMQLSWVFMVPHRLIRDGPAVHRHPRQPTCPRPSTPQPPSTAATPPQPHCCNEESAAPVAPSDSTWWNQSEGMYSTSPGSSTACAHGAAVATASAGGGQPAIAVPPRPGGHLVHGREPGILPAGERVRCCR